MNIGRHLSTSENQLAKKAVQHSTAVQGHHTKSRVSGPYVYHMSNTLVMHPVCGRTRETKFPYISCWGISPKISLNTLTYHLPQPCICPPCNPPKCSENGQIVVSHSQDLNSEELEALPFMIWNKQGCLLNCAEVLTNNKRKQKKGSTGRE